MVQTKEITKVVEVTDKVICNVCGKEIPKHHGIYEEFFSIHRSMGYFSKHDGDLLNLDICNDCMEDIINNCRINPIVENAGEIYD